MAVHICGFFGFVARFSFQVLRFFYAGAQCSYGAPFEKLIGMFQALCNLRRASQARKRSGTQLL